MNSLASKTNSNVISNACNLSEKLQKQLVEASISSVSNPNFDLHSINFEGLSIDEDVYDLIGLYIKIIKHFIQNKQDEFSHMLIEEGFTQNFIENFPIKYEQKEMLIKNVYIEFLGNVKSLGWRIDISLSNNVLKRKVPPWIIISLKLSTNKNHILVLDINTFHKFRYNVALILKELSNLKKCNILRK